MNYVSSRTERLILADPTDSRVARNVTTGNRLVAIFTSPDLILVVMLSVIGLLATVAVDHFFPDFGAVSQSLQQFL